MGSRLKVLFIVSHPLTTPTISVHADLMRRLDRGRVEVHVLVDRLAAREPFRSSPSSVLKLLREVSATELHLVDLGPLGGRSRMELAAGAARSAVAAPADLRRVVRLVRRRGIDVVHAEYGLRNGGYAWLVSRLARTPYVVHFHSMYGGWVRPQARFVLRRANGVIAVSRSAGQALVESGLAPDRVFPVLNGIDLSRWNPACHDGAAVRREFGLADGDPLVVMVAQLMPMKRQADAIEAFREVVVRHPRARLLLVGTEWRPPAPPAPTQVQVLRRLIAETGLERNVVLTGLRHDVPDVLAAADVFVLPSVGEPFGLATAEAMAMATPVVGVASGGTPELVEHGRTGLLGPPDDPAQLAANICALIDDPRARRELGTNGRRRAEELLDATVMAAGVERVYRAVTQA